MSPPPLDTGPWEGADIPRTNGERERESERSDGASVSALECGGRFRMTTLWVSAEQRDLKRIRPRDARRDGECDKVTY